MVRHLSGDSLTVVCLISYLLASSLHQKMCGLNLTITQAWQAIQPVVVTILQVELSHQLLGSWKILNQESSISMKLVHGASHPGALPAFISEGLISHGTVERHSIWLNLIMNCTG